jgi:AhpD family alkylhydroperoxidase
MESSIRRYNKRIYSGPREFILDIFIIARNIVVISSLMRKNTISGDFRERLMLAVTSVYRCRHCNWVHTKEALRHGVSLDEINGLMNGSVDACPQDEAVALVYAQHWADWNAKPDPEACLKLEQTYGKQKSAAIDLILRMIRVGNLSGNTWDCFLFNISFGRWGGAQASVQKSQW